MRQRQVQQEEAEYKLDTNMDTYVRYENTIILKTNEDVDAATRNLCDTAAIECLKNCYWALVNIHGIAKVREFGVVVCTCWVLSIQNQKIAKLFDIVGVGWYCFNICNLFYIFFYRNNTDLAVTRRTTFSRSVKGIGKTGSACTRRRLSRRLVTARSTSPWRSNRRPVFQNKYVIYQ